jgi:glycolate oxidase
LGPRRKWGQLAQKKEVSVYPDSISSADIVAAFTGKLPEGRVLAGNLAGIDYSHDEAYAVTPQAPVAVILPRSTAEVSTAMKVAGELGCPVTPRGSGTGLAGGCIPAPGGVVMSMEKMSSILEVDTENNVAVVQPGVTLSELDEMTSSYGLAYPVVIGEKGASLGGTVATNAGGMQAVKYGVTRNHVLGLEVVLGSGEVIRTGGKVFKRSSGYDLTQLFTGSEGTLGIVTEAIVRLVPRMRYRSTLLVPFNDLTEAAGIVPLITSSGVAPLVLEYIDALSMDAITKDAGLELGVEDSVKARCSAYLVIVLEGNREALVDQDMEDISGMVAGSGALDVYVLPPTAGTKLLEARDKAHWMAKANGADDIVDVVVPRSMMSKFMEAVSAISEQFSSLVVGCGHAGDGNVHLSIFQPDERVRHDVVRALLRTGIGLGGDVSAEHGIGKAKREDFLDLTGTVEIDLMRRIKSALDPKGILSPGNVV